MIVHSLEFYNFLPFYERQQMHFDAEKDSDRPFTLIIAPTNSGKTTTIRALRFLFYNEINDGEEIGNYHKLVNHRAKLDCPANRNVEAWVKAEITWGDGEKVTFRRRIEAARVGDGMDSFSDAVEGQLERQVLDERTGHDFVTDDEFQDRIDLYAPRLLFNSFFFAGEPGEGHIDPTTASGAGLEDDIRRLFRMGAWQKARDALMKIQRGLSAVDAQRDDLQAAAENAFSAYQKAQDNLNECKNEILKLEDIIERDKRARTETYRKLLDSRPKGDAAEKFHKEAKVWEEKKTSARAQEKSTRADAENLVVEDCGKAFVLDGLKAVEREIAVLREQDLLPADVSKDFINKLLEKADKCICGRSLSQSEETAREEIKRHLELSLASNTSSALQGLAKSLESKSGAQVSSFEENENERAKRIEDNLNAEMNFSLAADDAERKAADFAKKVDEADIEESRRLNREHHKLEQKISADEQTVGNLKRHLSSLETSLKKRKEEYQEAKIRLPKDQQAATQLRELKSNKIQATLELLEETERLLKESLRESLQERVRDYYDGSVTDGSVAKIEHNLCPRIYRNEVVMTALGGGQKLMLQLAFVVALADLYREVRDLYKSLGLILRNSDHISLFADAPFAHAAQTYNEAIVNFLARTPSPQVVLLLHKQQWNAVENHLDGKVKQAFGYCLNTPKEVESSEEYEFELDGNSTSLLNPLKPGEEAFSEIVPITVS